MNNKKETKIIARIDLSDPWGMQTIYRHLFNDGNIVETSIWNETRFNYVSAQDIIDEIIKTIGDEIYIYHLKTAVRGTDLEHYVKKYYYENYIDLNEELVKHQKDLVEEIERDKEDYDHFVPGIEDLNNIIELTAEEIFDRVKIEISDDQAYSGHDGVFLDAAYYDSDDYTPPSDEIIEEIKKNYEFCADYLGEYYDKNDLDDKYLLDVYNITHNGMLDEDADPNEAYRQIKAKYLSSVNRNNH